MTGIYPETEIPEQMAVIRVALLVIMLAIVLELWQSVRMSAHWTSEMICVASGPATSIPQRYQLCCEGQSSHRHHRCRHLRHGCAALQETSFRHQFVIACCCANCSIHQRHSLCSYIALRASRHSTSVRPVLTLYE